jgi:protein-S-isoprenylcysteine O-methyltransferase Ste14
MFKLKSFIDSHKAITGLVVLGMIAWHNQWHNFTALAYLAMHGTYGILWALKSRNFPDKSWERPVSVWYGAFVAWGALSLYWVAPWLITSLGVQVSPLWLCMCLMAYAFGVFLHFASDMQKFTALHLRPGHLIQNGLFARVRNPNYFGELLIYAGFGLLAQHWLPLLVIALFVAFYWLPNMRRKDRSLSRYAEFAAYKERTKLFIPFVF